MISAPQPRRDPSGADDQDLLATLLASDIAGDAALLAALLHDQVPSHSRLGLAPARLRSTAEQRQIALRPFRLRTWVDTALHHIEQGLVIAAVAVFGYWFVDGPLRDWLYEANRDQPGVSRAVTPTPALRVPNTAPPAVAVRLPALPFTTPDMAEPGAARPASAGVGADFLVPQAIPARRAQPEDPRPQRLSIPKIGVDTTIKEVFVIEGAWQVADYAAGYHHGTGLPGLIGNAVLSGHAGLRGAVFRDIGNLKPGDEAIVETAAWRYSYRIREVRSVWPTQVEVMDTTATSVLTLITCTNWDTQRLIVVADLIDARPLS